MRLVWSIFLLLQKSAHAARFLESKDDNWKDWILGTTTVECMWLSVDAMCINRSYLLFGNGKQPTQNPISLPNSKANSDAGFWFFKRVSDMVLLIIQVEDGNRCQKVGYQWIIQKHKILSSFSPNLLWYLYLRITWCKASLSHASTSQASWDLITQKWDGQNLTSPTVPRTTSRLDGYANNYVATKPQNDSRLVWSSYWIP